MGPLTVLSARYVLESEIASGGMAVVWRATDRVLARTVAVKLLHAHLAADPDFVARFRFEATAAARLGHPNIVAIYDTGSEPGQRGLDQHFIVMEYCAGGSLADLVVSQGPLETTLVVETGIWICSALAYAHGSGIVHRDVKPGNVLLTEDGTVKVGDFGIAKAATRSQDLTASGAILGTVAYLSPEQAQGQEPDARSDLYSLGVVLYELLTGQPPFVADSPIATAAMHLNATPPPPRSVKPDIPPSVEAVVMRALEKDPMRRYSSGDEMRDELERAATGRREPALVSSPLATETGNGATASPSAAPRTPPRATEAQRRRSASRASGMKVPSLWPVVILIVLGILLAAVMPSLFRDDPAPRPQERAAPPQSPIAVASVADFDPHGDQEHPERTALAADGDVTTEWTTEQYRDPLGAQKPGVGLLFDLGAQKEIARVEVLSPQPGYSFELRAASDGGGQRQSEEDFEIIRRIDTASGREQLEPNASGRYWLVWITRLPGGRGGRASISEVRFFGR